MSQALYRKWRPNQWDQVVGQEHIVQTLRNAVRSGKIGHAYLFAGPRGTGKTTTARLLAKAFNCTAEDLAARPCDQCGNCTSFNQGRYLDLIEIDAASNTSVDDVRELRDKINFSPSQGAYKVYIIDEVHMLSTAAFNALLKTLEEPPPHAIFILATTEVHRIPATVLSRCQRFEFRRIPASEIRGYLKNICQAEKIDAEDEALLTIARQATGSMRDAISLLDQLASAGEAITLGYAQTVLGTATRQSVIDLVSALQRLDAAAGLACLHAALDSGSEPRQFARQVVEYLRGLLLVRLGAVDQLDVPEDTRKNMIAHGHDYPLPGLLQAIHEFNRAASDQRVSWQPALPLEVALANAISSLTQPPAVSEPAPRAPEKPQVSAAADGTLQNIQHQREPAPPSPVASASQTRMAGVEKSPPAEADAAHATQTTQPTMAPETPPVEEGSGLTLTDIDRAWTRIHDIIKSRRNQTGGLLNSCRRLAVKNGALVLGFATEVVRSKMDTPENINVTRAAIFEVLGRPINIVCVVAARGTQLPDDLDIDRDGMIGTALNMGGRIIDQE